MMSSSTSLASSLVHLDVILAPLNQKVAGGKGRGPLTEGTDEHENINHDKIVGDISKFLNDLKGLENSLDCRSVTKVIQKVETNIEQFVKDNPSSDHHYSELLLELSNRINELLKSFSASSIVAVSPIVSTIQNQTFLTDKYYGQKHLDFESALAPLSVEEKQCLAFCVAFFSNIASVEIKKRDLIQWWIGMELVAEPFKGGKILEKLVAEEFILETILIRTTPSSWYRMHNTVMSKLKAAESLRNYVYEAIEKSHHFIVYHQNREQISVDAERIAASINISTYTLDVETFEQLFLMKNVKLVHLGSWRYDMDYVVVEDISIRFLKALKTLKEIRFLSLQGVSRIKELPDSIYKLSKLKVLDLRGCEDLRHLPKGIGSLRELRLLDFSKCYQLVHIPRAITSLSKLIVLKGFTINPDQSDHKHFPSSSSCTFGELPKLKELRKLAIRTRRMNFPTSEDVKTLLDMKKLSILRISWVNCLKGNQADCDRLTTFPMPLKKLELQAAPENTASRILSLISHRRDNSLEKLYISGGGLVELDASMYYFLNVKVVRLRHQRHLHVNWSDFRQQFPSLTRIEIFGCPNLFFFPCDSNGVWDSSESS